MNLTIGVLYTCGKCGLKDVEVQVPARTTEDVVDWLRTICTPALVADHESRSPHCHPKKFDQVKVPMTGADRVGGAPVQ